LDGIVVGVDLGTSRCTLAVLDQDVPRAIPSVVLAMPSVVFLGPSGEPLVGEAAQRRAITDPRRTISAVLRLVGRPFDSPQIQRRRRLLPYQLSPSEDGGITVDVQGKLYRPIEILAFILKELRANAEARLERAVEGAIVTVPAAFTSSQRQGVRDAAMLAGLKVQRMQAHTTLAALAYGVAQRPAGRLAFVDFGAGTFDISILELQDGLYQRLSTAGDADLGGTDFDEKLTDWLAKEFQKERGVDPTEDPQALQRLREAAEGAKHELSFANEAEVVLPALAASPRQKLSRVLTRRTFEKMIEPFIEKLQSICREALTAAQLTPERIDEVVLMGGQAKTPRVATAVQSLFGKPPVRRADLAAAGAAVQVGVLAGLVNLVLLDATSYALGIDRNGELLQIVPRNSTIPTKHGVVVNLPTDEQGRVAINLLEGQSQRSADNCLLGHFRARIPHDRGKRRGSRFRWRSTSTES